MCSDALAVTVIPRGPSSVLHDGYQHLYASRLEDGRHAAGSTGADADGVTRRASVNPESFPKFGIQKGKKNGKINTRTCRLEMPSDVHLIHGPHSARLCQPKPRHFSSLLLDSVHTCSSHRDIVPPNHACSLATSPHFAVAQAYATRSSLAA